MLKDEEIGKERQGSFSSHLCFKYLFWMCTGPLLIWRKGPQTWSDTKAEKFYADCSWWFLCSCITSHLLGTEELLLWDPALVLSCLLSGTGWCWTPPGAQGWEGSWSSTFPVLQAEQHLQCLPRTARVWVGVFIPLQNLPTPGKKLQPSFPRIKQHSYLSVLQDSWIFVPAEAVSKAVKAFLL